MKMTHPQKKSTQGKAIFWMLFPVALLVTSVSGWLFMVRLAVDDPGFAVEPDYYKKAASYDEHIAQEVRNRDLGWRVQVEAFSKKSDARAELVLRLSDGLGLPLTDVRPKGKAFFNARATDVQELTFERLEGGLYRADLVNPRVGLWEVRLQVDGGADHFTQVLRPEMMSEGGGDS